MKIQFDEFRGVLWRRPPLPLFDGIDSGLDQHRTAPDDLSGLYFSVGCDQRFDSDGSGDLHFASQFRIVRDHLADDFSLRLRLILSRRRGRGKDDAQKTRRKGHCERGSYECLHLLVRLPKISGEAKITTVTRLSSRWGNRGTRVDRDSNGSRSQQLTAY